MLHPKVLLTTAAQYLRAHPEEFVRALRNALGLRVGVPLDALRFLMLELAQGKKAPRDVVIESAPPGLALGATVRLMGATLRAELKLFVEELDIGSTHARVTCRIADLTLAVLDGADTPVAGLIKSGALDLSKPGNLAAYMPKRPELLVEAADDRVVLDLLKAPKLAQNAKLRRMLAVLSPVLRVVAVRSHDDHLDAHFKVLPGGVADAVAAVTNAA